MYWEPFEDTDTYPFLDVQRHFAANGVRVPSVEAIGKEIGVVLLEDLGDLTLKESFGRIRIRKSLFPSISRRSMSS